MLTGRIGLSASLKAAKNATDGLERQTFAGADLEDNWKAMFKMAELFGRLVADVGARLGYAYPAGLERDVTEYMRNVKVMADGRAEEL